jgi:hypothetical protein
VAVSLSLSLSLSLGRRLNLDLLPYLDAFMNPVPDQDPSSAVPASLIMRVTVDVSVRVDVA